jgi:hypothetical protein
MAHLPVDARDHHGPGPDHRQHAVLQIVAALAELQDQLRPRLMISSLQVGDIHAVQHDRHTRLQPERGGIRGGPPHEIPPHPRHRRRRGIIGVVGTDGVFRGDTAPGPPGQVEILRRGPDRRR